MPRTAAAELVVGSTVPALRGSAFGLRLEAGYALPGLAPPAAATGRSTRLELVADAAIDEIWRPEQALEMRRVHHPDGSVALLTERDDRAGWLFTAPGIGRHLVSGDGSRVLSAPAMADPALWHLVLMGQVLPAAAALAGLEVMHAGAVAVDGGAVALSGPPGAGKSTVAVHLTLLGGVFITDDVLALECRDDAVLAYPGPGLAGLRREALPALRHLGARPAVGPLTKARLELQPYPRALPLRALYFLDGNGEADLPRIEPLAPELRLLLGSAYSLAIRTPGRLGRQLDVHAAIARSVPVFRAQAPRGGEASLAARLLEHATTLGRDDP